MVNDNGGMSLGHVITWWNAARFTSRDALKAALEAAGHGEFTPEKRTPQAALRSALDEVFPSRNFRVEPLRDRNAYEVVETIRGEQENEYRHRLWVGIDSEKRVEVRPYDYRTADRIVSAFNAHQGLVTASAVTGCLLGILKRLKGNRMREDGGLYGLRLRQDGPPTART